MSNMPAAETSTEFLTFPGVIDPGTEETFACWLALHRTEEASFEGCDGASFQEQGWC